MADEEMRERKDHRLPHKAPLEQRGKQTTDLRKEKDYGKRL